jgi:glutaredoxin
MRLALLILLFLATCLSQASASPPVETRSERERALANDKVEVAIFWEPGCPFCLRAKEFLAVEAGKAGWLSINAIDISASSGNQRLFEAVNRRYRIQQPGIPLIIVGGRLIMGYDTAATTGAEIIDRAESCRSVSCPDLAALLAAPDDGDAKAPLQRGGLPETVELPFFGPIEIKALSLPALTVILAAIDGFNPCAMWVLVFLIGLLLGMQDRARMWLLGGAFLLTSGVVYFAFLAAWLNVFLVLGALVWVRLAVGILALASGGYYLHAFVTDAAAECRVTSLEQRTRIMDAMRANVREPRFLVALGGIITIAFGVNLIELLCSAGIPAVFTEVLAMSNLQPLSYYGYVLLYVIVFMIDDAAIFMLAMLTLKATGMTNRYLRASHLIGGIVMAAIGALLLFAPDWLVFAP